MSRLANKPINIPNGVTVNINPDCVSIIGVKKAITLKAFPEVAFLVDNSANTVRVALASPQNGLKGNSESKALVGTMWALLRNALRGVSEGFKNELELIGVGYRVQGQGNELSLILGYSHSIMLKIPEGITVEIPSQTSIRLSSEDKHLLGQFSAKIRSYRPVEPYKGKGIKTAGLKVILKETKKK